MAGSSFWNGGLSAGQRRDNRRVVRTILLIGILTLVFYVLGTPYLVAEAYQADLLYAAALMMAPLVAYWYVIGTGKYLEWEFIDVPFLTAAFIAQCNLNSIFFGISKELEFTPIAIVVYNAAIFVFAAAISIAGSLRAFLLQALIIAVVCTAFSLRLTTRPATVLLQLTPFYMAVVIAAWANLSLLRGKQQATAARLEVERQRAQTEELLYNVLPENVARRLRNSETVADSFAEVAVVFIDIVDFSSLSRTLSPKHLVETLNAVFVIADECAARHGVEKVKTIGDAYLAVAGATIPAANCAVSAIAFAGEVIETLAHSELVTRVRLQVRAGVHTGAVVGGVIGTTRKAYDFWGDTVNMASRIQSAAGPGTVLASEATFFRTGEAVTYDRPRLELLKGIGEAKVYPVIR